jgi:hypothetical protein
MNAEPECGATRKRFPHLQTTPHPTKVAFELDGVELFAYQYRDAPSRPFLFPVIGPSGRHVTRIGHPHDPSGHRHHYSVWLGHESINGVDFWGESEQSGKQVHIDVVKLEDGVDSASMLALVQWRTTAGQPLLEEIKKVSTRLLEARQYLIELDLTFQALIPAEFGATPFGPLGVRVAKTMSVNDGGGTIINSEGGINEAQIFWRRARWCDYAGPVNPMEWNGITILDHPQNRNHPTPWHVRDDGWMGPALFFENPFSLAQGERLRLRYGLFVHAGNANAQAIEALYKKFAGTY